MTSPAPPVPPALGGPSPGGRSQRSRPRSGCLLIGMLVGAIVLGVIFLGLLVVLSFGSGPSVPEDGVLVIGTEDDYPETLSFAPLFFSDSGTDFGTLLAAVARAADDPQISGVHLRVGETKLGWARARDLRDAVLAVREAGKPVTASLEYASLLDYYLASAAERIFVHPRGQLGLYGVSMEVLYYGELLDKLGVEAQFEAIGPFKTGPEVFTGSEMSDEQRTQLASIGNEFREEIAAAVAESRSMTPEAADALLSGGPHTAAAALESGLVDALSYQDQIRDEVGDENLIALDDYLESGALGRVFRDGDAARVAIVHVDGAILPGKSREDLSTGKVAGAETVREALRWAENSSMDAVVLRVSSPGGADSASDTIWRAAERVRAEKPLVASFGDTAASGGYWVSTAARKVVAAPLTVTGSIGVWVGKFSVGGLLEKIGLSAEIVSSGGQPNWLSPSRPLDEDELARLREGATDTYRVFIERVATARPLSVPEVEAIAGGRVFSGRQALEAGLVDELGGLHDAVRLAATEAGFPEDAPIETVVLPEPPSLFDRIAAGLGAQGVREKFPVMSAALSGVRMALLPFVAEFR